MRKTGRNDLSLMNTEHVLLGKAYLTNVNFECVQIKLQKVYFYTLCLELVLRVLGSFYSVKKILKQHFQPNILMAFVELKRFIL